LEQRSTKLDIHIDEAAAPAPLEAVSPSYGPSLRPQQRGDLVQLLQDQLLRLLHLTDLLGVHLERVPVPARVKG